MIEKFKIKGLEKLANTGVIKDIYPMVDRVDIRNEDPKIDGRYDRLEVDIHVNDETMTKEDMYYSDFDPHYLVDYHLKQYFPYFDIDNTIVDFIVWGPNGEIIYSWQN
jgi:hypothetical protein